MTPRDVRRVPARRAGTRRPRIRSVLGIPLPMMILALIIAALLGVQLATALEQSTTSASHMTGASVDSGSGTGTGKNSAGLTVVTEASLGTEVQRLVDTGTIQPMTSFDAAQCQQEQGITESILIMEEVSWGGEDTTGWLLVHGPVDRETLRANGGIISATVVLPTCGTGAHDEDPGQDRLWAGHVMIGPL
ncbi:hypothetical protein [Brachybacterium paraconglomeratum]|uniref:hypothetical protein n=1 Tax=Brachybacterium paraconglomeratum TaxID=173362 RepID=UPI003F7BD7DA